MIFGSSVVSSFLMSPIYS